jgi:hypothetical protein
MDTNSVATALEQVRPFLFDYLVAEGVITTDNPARNDQFICPNPNHEDTAPSAKILRGGVKAFCHGCKTTFDLLHVNHWIKSAPISGFGFITNNLMPLCERFKVDFELGDLSEEDRFKLDSFRVIRMASDYMSAQLWSEELRDYVEARGVDVVSAQEMGISVIPNYSKFFSHLRTAFSNVFLREVGLAKEGMFSSSSIIFTIKDHNGTPVGFISRDMEHEAKKERWRAEGSRGAPPRKYDSSPEKNRIYFKRSVLFGFSDAVSNDYKDLYGFEGQFDWAIAKKNGLDNSIALSGSSITPDQISLLRKYGIESLTLVMDGDSAGEEALEKLLLGDSKDPGMLASASFLNVYVITIPSGYDPNSYIVENGMEAFKGLERVSSFQWALNRQDPSVDPLKACEAVLPFILAEDNFLRRERMVDGLSEATGLSTVAINDELHRREDANKQVAEREMRNIADEALREFRYGDGAGTQILRNALDRIEAIDSVTVDTLSSEETIAALDAQIQKEFELEGPQGHNYGKLTHFTADLNGESQGVVIAVGGVPNTGKTALQSQFTKELLDNNPNLIIIAQTIDDTRAQFNRRMAIQWAQEMATEQGLKLADAITLNKIASPKYWLNEYPRENEGLMECREEGYKRLREYLKDGRLHIKDTTHGATLVMLEKLVKKVYKDHPGAEVVVILDNFHKAQDFSNLDERSAVKKKSAFLKRNIAQAYNCSAISTFEYKKVETGKRPVNNDLRDAVNIEYDINYLINLFSPLKAAQDTGEEEACEMWHGDEFNKLPIIEGDVGKNKITDLKGRRFFGFYPAQSRYECYASTDVSAIVANNRGSKAIEAGHEGTWKNGRYFPADVDVGKTRLVKAKTEVPF